MQPKGVEMGAYERGRVSHQEKKFCVHFTIFTVFMDKFTSVGNDVCTRLFTAAWFDIAKGWKELECPIH